MLYEVTVRAAGGDELVMANYLPIALESGPNQWLLRQREGSIHSWPQLQHMFIQNYRTTC